MRIPAAMMVVALAAAQAGAQTASDGACSCASAKSPGAFARCVRGELRKLPKAERRSDAVTSVRRLAASTSCGREALAKTQVACCLPLVPEQAVVAGRMCKAVSPQRCTKLGGVAMGAGVACAPSPCGFSADIPVAHTPPGGYGDDFPPPILAGCTEPLAPGAPDLRGMWQTESAEIDGAPAPPEHRVWQHFQRIEQCGDRLVVTAGGVVHDMRCDGTAEHGVNDVAERDFISRITVVATFEDGVHVLRPVGIPIEVTRRLDGDVLVWHYVNVVVRLRRLGGPETAPPDLP